MSNTTSVVKTFIVLKKRTVRWDGSEQTAAYFGYGDYVDIKWDEVGRVMAVNEKEARKLARRLFKERRWPCYFSRTGINCLLEEVKL